MNRFSELNPDWKLARLHRMAEEALRQYDIGRPSVSFVGQSFNAIFRVEADGGERFVLRVHRFNVYDAIQMRSEFHWLNFLRQSSGVLVSEPIANRNGDFVTELAINDVPGRHYCTMLRWHPGSPIEVGCHSDHYVMIGELLANMHSHSSRFVPPAGFVRPWRGIGYARKCVEQIRGAARPRSLSPRHLRSLESIAEGIDGTMADIGHGARDFGMIHGDLHGGNILLHDRQLRAIDFDGCGWGHYLYDLAVALYHLSPEAGGFVLKGYARERALRRPQILAMRSFYALRALDQLAYHVHDPSVAAQTLAKLSTSRRLNGRNTLNSSSPFLEPTFGVN